MNDEITVGELIKKLQAHDKNKVIQFGNSANALHFNELKQHPDFVQFKFDERVYRENGKLVIEED